MGKKSQDGEWRLPRFLFVAVYLLIHIVLVKDIEEPVMIFNGNGTHADIKSLPFLPEQGSIVVVDQEALVINHFRQDEFDRLVIICLNFGF